MFNWFRKKQPSPPPPERWRFPLSEFLGFLQANGFPIGIDTHILLQAVLQKLDLPADLPLLPQYLSPLLAQNQEQQAFLYIQIPCWFYTESVQAAIGEEIPNTGPLEAQDLHPEHVDTSGIQTDQPGSQNERERMVLHLSGGSLGRKGLSFAVPEVSVEYSHTLLYSLRQLRFLTDTGRRSFDLNATLRALTRQGTLETPKWRNHRSHVSYIFIVEQNIHRDHRAAMVRQLYHTLLKNNVYVLFFIYHTDPRLLQASHDNREHSLRELASAHADAILLYFGNGDHWMSPETLILYRWTDTYRQWAQRYWFPINPPDRWSLQEEAGAQIFPQMLPFTSEGLQQLARSLAFSDNDEAVSFDFWPQHIDYNHTEIDTRWPLADLALFFSPHMRRWIAACAVYPEINWELSIALGRLLSPPGLNLCHMEAIAQLLRLDWFRLGYMPPPVRYALLKEWLDATTLIEIHAFIAGLMRQDTRLDILRKFPAYRMQLALHELMAATSAEEQLTLAQQLKADIEAGHQPTDLVSLHYLNEHQISPLFFVVPEELANYLESFLRSPALSSQPFNPIRKLEPEMVFVKGGTFQMGSPGNEKDRHNDEVQHTVTLSDFEIGKYPVTQKLWTDIMGSNPSHFKGDDLPVEQVNWDDCQEFLKKLNQKTGKKYRLPTEAEWEFAARGGNFSKSFQYAGSNDLNEVGWYWENSGDKRLSGKWKEKLIMQNKCRTHPVGQKKTNELGLYDMSGNVWEWCADWYDNYPAGKKTVSNPSGPTSGTLRVLRGGSWYFGAQGCRVAGRGNGTPEIRYDDIGFRLALSLQ